jgi:hypothetical protein
MPPKKCMENPALQRAGEKGMRFTLVGMFVNLGLALTKCTADFFGHSFALIADGLESAADVVTGLVVYFGLKIALKPPDKDHPYGHGQAEPIAALHRGLRADLSCDSNCGRKHPRDYYATSVACPLHPRSPGWRAHRQGTSVSACEQCR